MLPSQSATASDFPEKPSRNPNYITRLIEELETLRDGASIVNQLVAVGGAAAPFLAAALLHGRARSVYQPRCWIVEALAGLQAYDVLLEYLRKRETIADPEVCFAEDAVINTAARELQLIFSAEAFSILLELAETRSLPGVIEALGMYRHPSSIPCLLRSLENDLARSAAFEALRTLGQMAKQPVFNEVFHMEPGLPDPESSSSKHRRRACLRLLELLKLSSGDRQRLLELLPEKDPEMVLALCKILASYEGNRSAAHEKLTAIFPHLDWYLRDDARELLQKLERSRS